MGLLWTDRILGRKEAETPGDTEQEGYAGGEITATNHVSECRLILMVNLVIISSYEQANAIGQVFIINKKSLCLYLGTCWQDRERLVISYTSKTWLFD